MDASNPYAPPQATVRDVFVPTGAPELADRGTRLGAAILDGVIVVAMVFLPLTLANLVLSSTGTMDLSFAIPVVIGLAGCVAWIWLNVLYVSRNGQTIAKKMLGIKVVRTDGSRASLGRIFWLRNVVNGLLGFIPFYGLVEVLFIFGEQRQCLHDKIADTIVVKA